MVRREYITAIGPVDMMCRDELGRSVAVEIKRRGEIELPKGADRDTAGKAALDDPGVARSLEGLNVRKVIVVPDRIVNIVAG